MPEDKPVDGDKTRDFVFVKMKQKDVDFMKSAIRHLWQQTTQGWGPTYTSAPWVLVMALPFVSFVLAVVLRSSLASYFLSTFVSFLLFMRIYATQTQFLTKIDKLKHKVTRYHDRVERMQDEIDVGGQELKESVREQLRLNEFSTMLQDRLAELEREVKRTRFASLREIEKELSSKETMFMKAKSFDQAMPHQQFRHRKRGQTQIIKYIPCEEEEEERAEDGDVDDEDDFEDGDEDMDIPAGHADREEAEEEKAKEGARPEEYGNGKAEEARAKTKSSEEEDKDYLEFLQRMDTLRERDLRLMRESNEEEYAAPMAGEGSRPDWREDRDESEEGSVRMQMTTGDFSSEEDGEGTYGDITMLGSQSTTILHTFQPVQTAGARESDDAPGRRRPELENAYEKREEIVTVNTTLAHEPEKAKAKSGSSRRRLKGSRITVHLASSTVLDPSSALQAKPLNSSNSCIPTFSSRSTLVSRSSKSDSSVPEPPPPPPPPPPPQLVPSPSSRFKFRFFPHMPRRHSSNSATHLVSAPSSSTSTSLPTSPLMMASNSPPVGLSPPASPRGLSTSSPTHTRPSFSLRKRGDSSSPPPLFSGGSGIQTAGSSSPPNKPKRGSMLLSLLPFSHEKDKDKDREKDKGGRESSNDDEQDEDTQGGEKDSSDESEGGGSQKRKKHHNPFALRRMKSKEDERMTSKREEKDKLKGEKEKEKKRAKEEKERVKEEKEEAKERKEEKEPKKRLVDGVKRLYHRRTRSAAACDIAKDL